MGIARAIPFFVGELASMVEAASGWSPVLRRHFEQADLRVHRGFDMPLSEGDAVQRIFLYVLVAPLIPAGPAKTGEQFQIRSRRACLDDAVNMVGLAGMLAFLRNHDVGGSSRIHVESNAEVHHFRTHSFLTGYQVQDTARWESKIQ